MTTAPKPTPPSALPDLMRGVHHTTFSDNPDEAFTVTELPVPQPTPDTVVMKTAASSVDRGSWHLMTGKPYLIRAAGFGLRTPRRANPGMAVSGVVAAVHPSTTDFSVGQPVMGIGQSTFAEYVAMPVSKTVPAPVGVGLHDAATLPISALTAVQLVEDAAEVTAADRVLVLGASGGVGCFVVQLASTLGAEVTGICSTENLSFVTMMGAAAALDYTADEHPPAHSMDVIIDLAGNHPISRLRSWATPSARIIIAGGESAGQLTGGVERTVFGMLCNPFISQQVSGFYSTENRTDLARVAAAAESGALLCPIAARYDLADAAAAMNHLTHQHPAGKVVVDVTAPGRPLAS